MFNYFQIMLKRLKGEIVHDNPSAILKAEHFNDSAPELGDPCFLLSDYVVKNRVIEALISKGKYGDLDLLINADGSQEPLKDKAALRHYHVRMAFPETDNIIYLVAEIRGRSQAATDLLAQISYLHHKSVSKVNDNGIPFDYGAWYQFRPVPIVDGQKFSDTMATAEITSLALMRWSLDDTGGRKSKKISVKLSSLDLKGKQSVLSILNQWAKNVNGGDSNLRKDSAHSVASIFPPGILNPAAEWDNASITMKEYGKSVTVSIDKLDKLFIYHTPELDDISFLWDEADKRLQIISEADGINIPHIDLL